jgi:hypothetical protein
MRLSHAFALVLTTSCVCVQPSFALDLDGSAGAVGLGAEAGLGASSSGLGGGVGIGGSALGAEVSGGVSPGGAAAEVDASSGGGKAGAAASAGASSKDTGVEAGAKAGTSSESVGKGISAGVEAGTGRSSDAVSASRSSTTGAAVSAGGGAIGLGGAAPSGSAGNPRSPSALSNRASLRESPIPTPELLPADQIGAVTLPPRLAPADDGSNDAGGSRSPMRLRTGSLRPPPAVVTAPRPIVGACRSALVRAASPYGAVRVEVASTGAPRQSSGGGLSAPMEARIVYERRGRVQIRQARVTCQFDQKGQVIAAL